MNTVQIKNIKIGEGIPKICVPVVGRTREEILREARHITTLPADLVEWRADWYKDVFHIEKVLATACELQRILNPLPLLFTFRTSIEGGEREISASDYLALNIAAAESGYVDLIDAEAFSMENTAKEIISHSHDHKVKVIISSHDFQKTPPKEELIRRFNIMQDSGADIVKIAVMPGSRQDVLTLMEATLEINEQYARCPVITMSMAGTGVLSRLSGEFFGSAVTFGSAGQASAPGQIPVKELREILDIVHKSL
ncbi:MAG: type I 3-dehydroquinate dehydratase [Clostridia bacterium]|nr:type I 3-dehydroquinate dehydratase [Clostridia bacterium]MDY5553972.1 type I 3-dehydroquinate dehydratase [Blautia sp.]